MASRVKPWCCLRPPGPTQIAVGIGDDKLTAATLRNAAAALVRAAGKRASIATSLADLEGVESATAAQAVVEGALLAAYRYHGLKTEPPSGDCRTLTLVVGEHRTAGATLGARPRFDDGRSGGVGERSGQQSAGTHDRADDRRQGGRAGRRQRPRCRGLQQGPVAEMGCGGMVGVNRGSVEPPRMVRLTYTPAQSSRPSRAGRQGRDVRLRRPQPEDRTTACDDEDGHERRGGRAGGDDDAEGAEVQVAQSPAT